MRQRRAIVTSTPEKPPPNLLCPNCDRPLTYQQTIYNGVKPIEAWHQFSCPRCGSFEYRERTRNLRAVED